jgi:hypothetical protein
MFEYIIFYFWCGGPYTFNNELSLVECVGHFLQNLLPFELEFVEGVVALL